MNHSSRIIRLRRWSVLLIIFSLALLVRVATLDNFITADEPFWIYSSRWFAGGLLGQEIKCPPAKEGRSFETSGWGCTLQSTHPGVTTMWAGSLGLLAYYWQTAPSTGLSLPAFLETVDADNINPAFVGPVRLPLAVINSLFLLAFYLLLRWLIREPAALLATLLVAFNPFHVALSRVFGHDALNTTFMMLSLLTLIGYWWRGWRWYWLLLSGVMAGLACLSKSIGLFMGLYAVMLSGLTLYQRWQTGSWRAWIDLRRLTGELFLWGLAAGLTIVALWPATWVIPQEVLRVIFQEGTDLIDEGHLQYFLGQISTDPGPLFYPVGWLLEVSPLEIIGLLALLIAAWRSIKPQPLVFLRRQLDHRSVELPLALFLVMFLVFETVSSKKMVRYFLPAFPMLDVFVALGLLWLGGQIFRLRPGWKTRPQVVPWALNVLVLLVYGGLLWTNYPYYFTYYNPLFGGAAGAARIMTVGWGEGTDQMAAYLNQQPQAESLHVAICGYERALNTFFVGNADAYSDVGNRAMSADFLVYYLSYVQRGRCQETRTYFNRHYKPVQRVTLQGLDYALIYQNPIQRRVHWQDSRDSEGLTVLGYELASDGLLKLFWQNSKSDPSQLVAGLAPPLGGETRWTACLPRPDFAAELTSDGAIIESDCPLAATATPPEIYKLRLGLRRSSAVSPLDPSGPVLLSITPAGTFKVDVANALIALAQRQVPASATPLSISLGSSARLVGYELTPAAWQPGRVGEVRLYFQPVQQLAPGLADALRLVFKLSPANQSESLLATSFPLPPQPAINDNWKLGSILPIDYSLSLPATLPSGDYVLNLCLMTVTNQQPVFCSPFPVKVVTALP